MMDSCVDLFSEESSYLWMVNLESGRLETYKGYPIQVDPFQAKLIREEEHHASEFLRRFMGRVRFVKPRQAIYVFEA